jgi:hypothetical protein
MTEESNLVLLASLSEPLLGEPEGSARKRPAPSPLPAPTHVRRAVTVECKCICGKTFSTKKRGEIGFFKGCDKVCSEDCLDTVPLVGSRSKTPSADSVQKWLRRSAESYGKKGVPTVMAALVPHDGGKKHTVVVAAANADIAAIMQYLMLQGMANCATTSRFVRLAGEACRAGFGRGFFEFMVGQVPRQRMHTRRTGEYLHARAVNFQPSHFIPFLNL